MIVRIFFQIFLVVLFSFQYITFAQAVTNPDSALQNILEKHKGLHISLKDAIDYALKNSTSVRSAEASYMAALGSVRRESGYFDPEFFLNMNYQDQNAPTASFFSGAPILKTQQTNYQTGLRMNLPIGTELELSINGGRLNTNSEFAFLNPEYSTFGSITFRQSLFGGFTATARENLSRTERELEAQKSRFDQETRAISTVVENTYWDLYAIERNYAVQELIHDQAKALMNETQLRANSGLVGPDQVANAKTFLAEQELLLLDREEQLDNQSDLLASIIGVRPDSSTARFIPLDNPPKNFNVGNIDELIELAKNNNLNLQAAQYDIEAVDVQRKAAKWKSYPTVNVVGSYSGTGLAGSARDVVFSGQVLRSTRGGSFGDAINQVGRVDFPGWNLGVEISLPIGLRSGLGEKDRLEAQVLYTKYQYTELSRTIDEQVRVAWRELSHGNLRIKAAAAGVDAAQEQVRIGLIEFHNGRATAFELVRLGADLATAQQRYSEALVRTAKAAATLRQLTSGKNITGER